MPGRSRIGDGSNTTLPSQATPQLVSQDLSYVPPQLDRERRTANVGIAIRTPPTQQEVVPVAENEPMRPRICPLHPDLGMYSELKFIPCNDSNAELVFNH